MKSPLLLASATLISLASAGSKDAVVSKETLKPFLETYCIECHGPKKQKGQVRFDQALWEITDNDSAQRWQDVLDQLNGGDMPPFDADEHPTNKELTAVLDSLTGSVNTARKRLTDHRGEIKMRRLNRREYAATIREIFGFDVSIHDIPEDGEIATFDTVGAEQFFTSAHFEKYLELGRKVAKDAFAYNTRPREKVSSKRFKTEEQYKKLPKRLAEYDRQKALLDAGKTWKEAGFKDEGAMQILLSQWNSRAELPRRLLQYPHAQTGVYNSNASKSVGAHRHTDIRANNRPARLVEKVIA